MTTTATTTSSPSSTPDQWKSKLGTSYDKSYMQQHESKFFHQLQELRDQPANRHCADCGVNGTVWASVNLGVFLCMTCGSHHRSLGTHISLPKGCTGTYWWGPDELERMKAIGNARAAELYGDESSIPNGVKISDSFQWKEYLTNKYVHHKFQQSTRRRTKTNTTTTTTTDVTTNEKTFRVPISSRLSPKKKFGKQTIPDIDLIHFSDDDEDHHHHVNNHKNNSKNTVPLSPTGVVHPPVQPDFFGQFGL